MTTSADGQWMTIEPSEEEYLEGDTTIHVVPLYGRQHELWEFCWCDPERDRDVPEVLVHQSDH